MVEIKFNSNYGRITLVVRDAVGLEWIHPETIANFYHSAYLVMIKQENKTYIIPMSNIVCILVENPNEQAKVSPRAR